MAPPPDWGGADWVGCKDLLQKLFATNAVKDRNTKNCQLESTLKKIDFKDVL